MNNYPTELLEIKNFFKKKKDLLLKNLFSSHSWHFLLIVISKNIFPMLTLGEKTQKRTSKVTSGILAEAVIVFAWNQCWNTMSTQCNTCTPGQAIISEYDFGFYIQPPM